VTAPDFQAYSLAMFCGGKRVFTSREGGLKPLVEWLAITLLASRPAREFLDGEGIALEAVQTVDHILTPDRSTVCPGEVIALETPERQEFLARIYGLLKIDPGDYENCRGKCGYTPWCRQCVESRGLR